MFVSLLPVDDDVTDSSTSELVTWLEAAPDAAADVLEGITDASLTDDESADRALDIAAFLRPLTDAASSELEFDDCIAFIGHYVQSVLLPLMSRGFFRVT